VTPIIAISGGNFQVIQTAVAEFLKRRSSIGGFNMLDYDIKLFSKDEVFIVLFQKAALSPGFRGSPEGFPGFEVEIEPSSLEIRKARFVR